MILQTTASTLKAILCYIDPEKTPKIAFDNDEYAKPLADKIKLSLGERDGSQSVTIIFQDDEQELKRQFNGVCENIKHIFDNVAYCSERVGRA